jgi:hypothetical protein
MGGGRWGVGAGAGAGADGSFAGAVWEFNIVLGSPLGTVVAMRVPVCCPRGPTEPMMV